MRRILLSLTMLCAGTGAMGQVPENLVLEPFITQGLNQPLGMAVPPDGSGRLFVIEKSGRIKVWRDGALDPTVFLDVSALVGTAYTEGLMDLAFHPAFASNGRVFIKYATGNRQVHIVEYRSTPGDVAATADPGSARSLLVIHTPRGEHNGGTLAFGPDGHLYIATGDGGGQLDPAHNGQNLAALMGKVLRIDVDIESSTHANACGGSEGVLAYGIPADNPFVGSSGICAEIIHYGLRNPWRFSFDRDNHDLFIADVGQFSREEINRAPADALLQPLNFGWRCWEGSERTNLSCDDEPLHPPTFPIIEYPRAQGITVIGGHRYRGAIHGLRGAYLFADLNGRIRSARETKGAWSWQDWRQAPGTPVSFGEDADGELYLLLMSQHAIHRITTDDSLPLFTVATAIGAGGSVYPAIPLRVEADEQVEFLLTPDVGHVVQSASGCNGELIGLTFTTGPTEADCVVTVQFIGDNDEIFSHGFEGK